MGGILTTLDRAISAIQTHDLIEYKTVYIELDSKNYELITEEVETLLDPKNTISVEIQKSKNLGECKILTYLGYKIIITVNKNKENINDFYFAFKTKIL